MDIRLKERKISGERIKEIFSVPVTNQLMEEFKENQNEQLEQLTQKMQDVLRKKYISKEKITHQEVRWLIERMVEYYILISSIEEILNSLNGKTFDQTIQEEIKKMMITSEVINKIADVIQSYEEEIHIWDDHRMLFDSKMHAIFPDWYRW